MIIGIDIDDTITNYHRKRLSSIKKFLKKKNIDAQIIDKNASNTLKICNWTNQECHNFWSEVGNTILENCKPQKDCAKIINKLKTEGNKIVLITARNDYWHGDAEKITLNWLNKNKIPFDKVIYDCATKKQIMIKEKIDLMIDDSPSVCIEGAELNINTILFCGPQNKNFKHTKIKKAKNWKKIYSIIKSIQHP